jgi:hypothetical protein
MTRMLMYSSLSGVLSGCAGCSVKENNAHFCQICTRETEPGLPGNGNAVTTGIRVLNPVVVAAFGIGKRKRSRKTSSGPPGHPESEIEPPRKPALRARESLRESEFRTVESGAAPDSGRRPPGSAPSIHGRFPSHLTSRFRAFVVSSYLGSWEGSECLTTGRRRLRFDVCNSAVAG